MTTTVHSATLEDALTGARRFHRARRLPEAERAYRTILLRHPACADAQLELGLVLHEQGWHQRSAATLQRASELRPKHLPTLLAWSEALQAHDDFDRALHVATDALTTDYRSAEAHAQVGKVLFDLGETARARQSLRRALELCPNDAETSSRLLWSMHADGGDDAASLVREHYEWGRRFVEPLRPVGVDWPNDPDPNRVLRIAYLSSGFLERGWGPFIEPLLERHDRKHVHVTCYCDNEQGRTDELTRRLTRRADSWTNVSALDDATLAARLRADRIDILLHIEAHGARHRLLALARRCAPLQATYLGYAITTGVSTIDHLITDAVACGAKPSSIALGENLIRLDAPLLCYRGDETVPVPDCPAIRNGYLTFGSFNELWRLSDRTLNLWAQLLLLAPLSRLRLTARGLSAPSAKARILRLFAAHGIPAGRIDLLTPVASQRRRLQAYAEIDIALDPFPHSDAAHACHALWMGVPTLGLAGRTPISRAARSILHHVGIAEFAAASEQEFLNTSVSLANDVSAVRAFRSGLRQRLRLSPICDESRSARALENACRGIWRQWCGA